MVAKNGETKRGTGKGWLRKFPLLIKEVIASEKSKSGLGYSRKLDALIAERLTKVSSASGVEITWSMVKDFRLENNLKYCERSKPTPTTLFDGKTDTKTQTPPPVQREEVKDYRRDPVRMPNHDSEEPQIKYVCTTCHALLTEKEYQAECADGKCPDCGADTVYKLVPTKPVLGEIGYIKPGGPEPRYFPEEEERLTAPDALNDGDVLRALLNEVRQVKGLLAKHLHAKTDGGASCPTDTAKGTTEDKKSE